MLGAIAAIVMVVGTVSATVSVTTKDNEVGEKFVESAVEVQTVEKPEFLAQ